MSKKNKKLKAEPETARYARQTNMPDYTLTVLYRGRLRVIPGNPSAVWEMHPAVREKPPKMQKSIRIYFIKIYYYYFFILLSVPQSVPG
ncbi:hypothetical protein JCM10003_1403 [Bacteroides pyogenes JCM 10003]|nr:hypothetical protein JCM10003_1403 [Bacteroides pyogenes JCM 10003]